jgi:hypothetical protein
MSTSPTAPFAATHPPRAKRIAPVSSNPTPANAARALTFTT